MRLFRLSILAICLLAASAISPGSARSVQSAIPRQHNGWGRFNVGSWKRVQVVSRVLDKKGAVIRRTTTETTSTLVEVSQDGYAVRVESVVDVAGRRFCGPRQIIRRGFYGQPKGQTVKVRRLGTEPVRIQGQEIPSEVRRLVVKGEGADQIVTVHYSDSVSPYVLRRETATTGHSRQTVSPRTEAETIAVDVPHKVLSEIKRTSRIRTVHRGPEGTVVTVEVHCPDVPGGVVQHVTEVFDPGGRLARTNTLQLLDYGTVEHQAASPPPRRRRFLRRGQR